MTINERKVFCLILEYLNDANYANLLLSEELHDDPHGLWMNRKTQQTGKSNRAIISFSFHGVGCSIETKDYHVDFDYCSDGKIQTFNSYMVYQHSKKSKIQMPEDLFMAAYEELQKNEIVKKSDDITGREEKLSGDIDWI